LIDYAQAAFSHNCNVKFLNDMQVLYTLCSLLSLDFFNFCFYIIAEIIHLPFHSNEVMIVAKDYYFLKIINFIRLYLDFLMPFVRVNIVI